MFIIEYFDAVIEKAMLACKNSDMPIKDHFGVNNKMVQIGSGAVRETIKKLGGTMPEDLPTPTKSVKQIEREKKKQLKLSDKNNKIIKN